MSDDLAERRKESLEAAREIKAARRRDKEDREILTERLQDLAAEQFECDPDEVEVIFTGANMEPIVYVPQDQKKGQPRHKLAQTDRPLVPSGLAPGRVPREGGDA